MPYGPPTGQSHSADYTLYAQYRQTDAWVSVHIDKGPLPLEADADAALLSLVTLIESSPDWTIDNAAKIYTVRQDATTEP